MPGQCAQDGIMRSAREADGELRTVEDDSGLALDEGPVDLSGVAIFKAPQLLGQETDMVDSCQEEKYFLPSCYPAVPCRRLIPGHPKGRNPCGDGRSL